MCKLCEHEVVKKDKGHYVIVHGDYTYEKTYKDPLEAMEECKVIQDEFMRDAHFSELDQQRAQDEFERELRERGY